jgi:hypothetical protein
LLSPHSYSQTQPPTVIQKARTRAPFTMSGPPKMAAVQTAAPLRRSIRSTRASQPIHDDASDEDESTVIAKKPTTVNNKTTTQPQEATSASTESAPEPRYNTRSKQVKSFVSNENLTSVEDEDVEELPTWPRYKDDLPNAFNGEVDPSLDFISKAPVGIIDNILSFLILDHDADRGIKMKEGIYKFNPHVLLSMSAMSRLFYLAVEGYARRFLTRHQEVISTPWYSQYQTIDPDLYEIFSKSEKKHTGERRRSSRLADKPQPEPHKVHRTELLTELRSRCALCLDRAWHRGQFANLVVLCRKCNESVSGPCLVCRSLSV